MPWIKAPPSEPGQYRVRDALAGEEFIQHVFAQHVKNNVLWPFDWYWESADGTHPTRIEEPGEEASDGSPDRT